MMNRMLSAAAAAAGALIAAQAPAAEALEPLQKLFPPDMYSSKVRQDVYAEGVRTYSGITLRSDVSAIGIDQITFRPAPDGDISVHIGALTMKPRDELSPAISISGISLQMEDWPAQGGDMFCNWMNVVSKANISAAEMTFPAEPAGIGSMRIEDLGFEARRVPENCWISGLLAVGRADVRRAEGASVQVSQVRSEIGMPGNRVSAAGSQGTAASLRTKIAEIELRKAGRTPTYGFSGVDLAAEMKAASLQGLLHVLHSSPLSGGKVNPDLNLMQMVNALTLLEMDLQASSSTTRIFSAGVVPPEAVTNFSRVGLSTVTGSSGLRILASKGDLLLKASASLNGLVDLGLTASADLAPYSRTKLLAANAGKELGAHLLPELSLKDAALTYKDRGLERYVIDLTGVPSGLYIEEFGGLLAEQSPKRIAGSVRQSTGKIAEFFRHAADAETMVIKAAPALPVRLAEMTLLALTDVNGLARKLGLTMRRG